MPRRRCRRTTRCCPRVADAEAAAARSPRPAGRAAPRHRSPRSPGVQPVRIGDAATNPHRRAARRHPGELVALAIRGAEHDAAALGPAQLGVGDSALLRPGATTRPGEPDDLRQKHDRATRRGRSDRATPLLGCSWVRSCAVAVVAVLDELGGARRPATASGWNRPGPASRAPCAPDRRSRTRRRSWPASSARARSSSRFDRSKRSTRAISFGPTPYSAVNWPDQVATAPADIRRQRRHVDPAVHARRAGGTPRPPRAGRPTGRRRAPTALAAAPGRAP